MPQWGVGTCIIARRGEGGGGGGERTAPGGLRDAKDPDREFVRNGTMARSVVWGGRKVPIRRPRVAATDGSPEPRPESFTVAAGQDRLHRVATKR